MRLTTPIEDADRLITAVKIAPNSDRGMRVISARCKKRKKNGDWYAEDSYDYSHREIPAEHWPVVLRQWAEERMEDADRAEQRAYDARQDAADARRLAKELEPKPVPCEGCGSLNDHHTSACVWGTPATTGGGS